MTAFQTIGIAVASLFVLLLFAALVRRRLRTGTAILWLLAWTGAGVTIANPDLTVALAHALGIARGADLVSYLGILSGMVAFFAVYARLRRIDAALTEVVRRLALSSPQRPGDGGAP